MSNTRGAPPARPAAASVLREAALVVFSFANPCPPGSETDWRFHTSALALYAWAWFHTSTAYDTPACNEMTSLVPVLSSVKLMYEPETTPPDMNGRPAPPPSRSALTK